MYMYIDQSRGCDHPGSINDLFNARDIIYLTDLSDPLPV